MLAAVSRALRRPPLVSARARCAALASAAASAHRAATSSSAPASLPAIALDVRRIPPAPPPGELAMLLPGHVRHLAHRLAAAGITRATACQAAAMPALAAASGPDALLQARPARDAQRRAPQGAGHAVTRSLCGLRVVRSATDRASPPLSLQSVTGSGKTLAYAVALLSRLDAAALAKSGPRAPPALQALVLVPTRELAVQVASMLTALAGPPSAKRKAAPLRIQRLVGLPTAELVARLRREPPHVAVCTPALAQALCAGPDAPLPLGGLRTLVLDEADELLANAIAPATKAVLQAASDAAAAPSDAPTDAPLPPPMLRRFWVSATVTPAVTAAAAAQSATPVLLFTDATSSAAMAGDVASSAMPVAAPAPRLPSALTHWRLALSLPSGTVPDGPAADAERAACVARLHAALAPKGPMLVFAPTAERAAPLVAALASRSFRAAALTASAPAERRARAALLRGVRSGRVAALVTTEMGARGLDLPRVALVVNAAPPAGGAGAYLHRAGRAGRHAPGAAQAAPVRPRCFA